ISSHVACDGDQTDRPPVTPAPKAVPVFVFSDTRCPLRRIPACHRSQASSRIGLNLQITNYRFFGLSRATFLKCSVTLQLVRFVDRHLIETNAQLNRLFSITKYVSH